MQVAKDYPWWFCRGFYSGQFVGEEQSCADTPVNYIFAARAQTHISVSMDPCASSVPASAAAAPADGKNVPARAPFTCCLSVVREKKWTLGPFSLSKGTSLITFPLATCETVAAYIAHLLTSPTDNASMDVLLLAFIDEVMGVATAVFKRAWHQILITLRNFRPLPRFLVLRNVALFTMFVRVFCISLVLRPS